MGNMNPLAKTRRHPWWLLLIEGFTAMILGGVLLWSPAKTQQNTWTLLVIILGLYWVISGTLTLARLAQNQNQWGWKVFTGILSILAGGYILVYPTVAAASLPNIIVLVLGVWGIIHGLIRFVMAFSGGGWISGTLGVLTIILGIVLVVNWTNPAYGLTLLYIASAAAIIIGCIMVVHAFHQHPEAYIYYV